MEAAKTKDERAVQLPKTHVYSGPGYAPIKPRLLCGQPPVGEETN